MTVASFATIRQSNVTDLADARNQSGRRYFVFVKPISGQRADFEKRRTAVNQLADSVTRQKLAAREVFFPGALAATERNLFQQVP